MVLRNRSLDNVYYEITVDYEQNFSDSEISENLTIHNYHIENNNDINYQERN